MGVREMDRFLEQWEMNARDLHRRMILAPTPRERALRQAQEMARPLVVGPRVDRLGDSGGLGTGPPHHRPMGRRLRRGRPGGFDIRADRRFSPPLAKRSRRS